TSARGAVVLSVARGLPAVPCERPHAAASFFLVRHPATSETYTLSLHDALPILLMPSTAMPSWLTHRTMLSSARMSTSATTAWSRSEEHTSELQSRENLVCRLLLEKKKALPARVRLPVHVRVDQRDRPPTRSDAT